MSKHFRTVCKHGKQVTQCRCIGPKDTILVDCPDPDRHKDLPVVHEGEVGTIVGRE